MTIFCCFPFRFSRRLIYTIFLSGLLVGCSQPNTQPIDIGNSELQKEIQHQQEAAAAYRTQLERRLFRVASRIQRAGVPICPKSHISRTTGVRWSYQTDHKHTLLSDLENRTSARYQQKEIIVATLPKDIPAFRAGLRPGDVIKGFNNRYFTNKDHKKNFRLLLDYLNKNHKKPIILHIQRAHKPQTIAFKLYKVCGYPVHLNHDDGINAFADGHAVHVTMAMMEFARKDEELALVVGHEFAHNAMGHIDASRTNSNIGRVTGTILDVAVQIFTGIRTTGLGQIGAHLGRTAYSVEFEQEADYVGLYFTRRAGYNIQNVYQFWRRFALRNYKQIDKRTTHPAFAERAIAIKKAIQEIKQKEKNYKPLRPNLKKQK
ncbi:M48 family metalloprotease [Magnetococcales bacterium HHB-1]